ncbi:MAG TPA: NUDIX hydrolase [Acidimicrobiales bacterium]|nr:NUDIX hydrolase [Acidimicrobiales bacterium]
MTEPQLEVPLDGLFLSPTPPWGTSVLVRRGPNELLLLRRRGQWGPPAATRLPDEPVATCAARALYELAGLRLPMWPLGDGDASWIVFVASVNDQHFVVDADEYEWVSIDEARRRCTDLVSATLDLVA